MTESFEKIRRHENYIFNWTFDKTYLKSSIFHGLKMREYIDKNLLYSYIKEDFGNIEYDTKWLKTINNKYRNDREMIKNYIKLYDKNGNYYKISIILPKHKWGRIGQSNYLSLSIMKRSLRHALCIGNYIDIDMENAQPTIINEIAKMNKIKCEELNNYVNDTLKYRNDIMKYYECDKETAKKLIIRLLFGGTYNQWVKDNNINPIKKMNFIDVIESEISIIIEFVYISNPEIKKDVLKINPNKWENIQEEKRGVMALWSQSIERIIQETAIMFLHKEKQFILEDIVPCQDGFMILKKNWYDNLLNDINNIIIETFNIKINFKVKPFNEAMIIPYHNEDKLMKNQKNAIDLEHKKKINEENERLKIEEKYIEIKTDNDAKIHFMNTHKNIFVKSAGQIYIKINNKWCVPTEIKEIIFNMVMNIKYAKINFYTELLYHYSGDTTGCRNITTAIYNSFCATDDPLFFNKISNSTINHLCFENGVYDMVDKIFYEWTNLYCEKIYTMVILPYNFNTSVNKDDILYVKQNLFINVFGEERATDFLKFLSRALSGNVLDKVFGIFTGERDCGKGVIVENLQDTFFNYIINITTDNFLIKKTENNDSEKAKSWMEKCQYGRLAVGSEIKSDRNTLFNGILLKSFTGNDKQTIRKNHVDPFDIRISTTLLLMANDLPDCNPKDAFLNHIRFKGQYRYKTKEAILEEAKTKPKSYIDTLKEANPEIKNLCKYNTKYRDALIQLIIDNFENKKPIYSSKVLNETDDLKDDAEEDTNIIFENFEFINDQKSIITDNKIKEFIEENNLTCSKNKFKDRLIKFINGVEVYKNGNLPSGEGRGLKNIKIIARDIAK